MRILLADRSEIRLRDEAQLRFYDTNSKQF
jgi:hypothetical protein